MAKPRLVMTSPKIITKKPLNFKIRLVELLLKNPEMLPKDHSSGTVPREKTSIEVASIRGLPVPKA